MRKFFLIGAAVLFATAAGTAQASGDGKLALGFLYHDQPLGIFYDLGNGSVLHAAVGFAKHDVDEEDLFIEIESEFGLAAAWLYTMWGGDDSGFGPSVGVAFTSMSPEGDGDSDSMTTIDLGFHGEWHATGSLSIYFSHGLEIEMISPAVGDDTTDFGLRGANVTDLGFSFRI